MGNSLRLLAVAALWAGCQGRVDVESLPVERPLVSLAADTSVCPRYFQGTEAQTITCMCPNARAMLGGNVYGSGPFSDHSDICRAAVYAGLDTSKPITLHAAPGCRAYLAGAQHGVVPKSYGSRSKSFVFQGGAQARCASPSLGAVQARLRSGCTERFDIGRGDYVCQCSSTAGSVWGSHPYTADSPPCRAAFHAGYVKAPGGTVRVRRAPGCERYVGSTANGITTHAWGAYATSYVFVRPGENPPGCP